MKLYVATSWRNSHFDGLVMELTRSGYEVWNWRKPPTGGNGFGGQDVGMADYQHGDKVAIPTYRNMLRQPAAQAGFASDLAGMNWADVGVLLLPSGRSAHLEAGWMAGRGKTVHYLCYETVEPDLMILALNGKICETTDQLLHVLARQ